jgi:hypothetical protein
MLDVRCTMYDVIKLVRFKQLWMLDVRCTMYDVIKLVRFFQNNYFTI